MRATPAKFNCILLVYLNHEALWFFKDFTLGLAYALGIQWNKIMFCWKALLQNAAVPEAFPFLDEKSATHEEIKKKLLLIDSGKVFLP